MSARAPSPGEYDDCPVAAIFRSPVFNRSEGFIQTQAAGLRRYQPLIVGLEDKGNAVPALEARILLAGGGQRLALKLWGRSSPLVERLRPYAPALLHAHFGPDGLLALPLARALGIPLVTTLHGYDVYRTRARLLLSGRVSWTRYGLLSARLAREGNLFLAVSDALRRKAILRGFPPERTVTHYLGVDLGRFRPSSGEARPGVILHVGRLVEKKGTAVLLDAFAAVRRKEPAASLVVIGDGPLRGGLERQSAALGLSGAVRFLGALSSAETGDWMRRAWVLAAPSVTARDGDAEGLPTVIVEAAASALPAVGSDHSGIPEAIDDGRTGFVVPERDAGALADRLLTLLGSADLRHRMGGAARALAEQRFDSARQTGLLEDHYDALAGRP